MTRAVLLALLLSCGAAAAAPAPAAIPRHDANQPIAISADRFVAEKNPAAGAAGAITGTYSGNVVITQGDIRMRANTVRINVIAGKPNKIFADGNVVVNSASGTATGDAGVYDVAPRLVTLTGHVVLTKEKNVMRGAQLTVNLVTGVAQLGGGGRVTGTHGGNGGGRVQGIFTPPPQSGGR
ncbi:MAG TPA: LptA/OstA family protein [Rhizomicrobium sp.]|jgi:lipopolysaccharide export system protein LptA|nr:LptA/OstA family protein [Rhizomicrobium sp.]